MKLLRWLALAVSLCAGQAATAQDATAIWNALWQPSFSADKCAAVDNVQISRDAIHITLASGTIQFAEPANGVVFAAAFQGRGRIQIAPPNDREKQQLQLLAKSDSVNLEFSEATFSFTEGLFDEVARQVHWGQAGPCQLGRIYTQRQDEREDLGGPLVPRLFLGVLADNRVRSAYFEADMKTDRTWTTAAYNTLDPEQVSAGHWSERLGPARFDTWMRFPARDQSPVDSQAGKRAGIRGYTIDASVTDGAELAAVTRLQLEERESGERAVLFHLNANLRVESVKDAQGRSLTFFQPREPKDRVPTYGDYIAVVLAQPSEAGHTETLEFRYAGKRVIREISEGVYFCPSTGWYPHLRDEFATRADFELTFHYPKRYVLVATGTPAGEPGNGTGTWKSEIPLAVAGFAYGDFKTVTQKVGSIDVSVFANRYSLSQSGGSAAYAKTVDTEIANAIRVFGDYFGPYPYSRLSATDIPYGYGQGWPMLLYLSSRSFSTGYFISTDTFRAHETSHQWWGNRVGWKSYHDQWMSEGFATFSGNLYVQFRDSPEEYLKRLRMDRQELIDKDRYGHVRDSIGPVWMGSRLASTEVPEGYEVVIYKKGGYILHMIRSLLNDNTKPDTDHIFKDTMRDFTQTFDNKAASTEDFKAVLEKHMLPQMDAERAHNMDWFFREYVYGTGIPHYDYETEIRQENGKWMVRGTITRSGVPDNWIDVLPVYVHAAKRVVRLGWIRATRTLYAHAVCLAHQARQDHFERIRGHSRNRQAALNPGAEFSAGAEGERGVCGGVRRGSRESRLRRAGAKERRRSWVCRPGRSRRRRAPFR